MITGASTRPVGRQENTTQKKSNQLAEDALIDTKTPNEEKRIKQTVEIDETFESVKALEDISKIIHPVKRQIKAIKSMPIVPTNIDNKYSLYQGKFPSAPGKETGLEWCND